MLGKPSYPTRPFLRTQPSTTPPLPDLHTRVKESVDGAFWALVHGLVGRDPRLFVAVPGLTDTGPDSDDERRPDSGRG